MTKWKMTTEELVKRLRDNAEMLTDLYTEDFNTAAVTIDRQAEALRVLREALEEIVSTDDDLEEPLPGELAGIARIALSQTKEFGE